MHRNIEALIPNFFCIDIFRIKNLRNRLLNTQLNLLYKTTATIPRGEKYYENPEANPTNSGIDCSSSIFISLRADFTIVEEFKGERKR